MHKLSHWWFCDASKLWHRNAEVRSVEWWLDLPLDHSSWKPGGREHLRLPAAWHGTSQDLSNPLRNRKAWCIMLKTACIHSSWSSLILFHFCMFLLFSSFFYIFFLISRIVLQFNSFTGPGPRKAPRFTLRFTVVNPASPPTENSWILELWSRSISSVTAAHKDMTW